MARVDLTVMGGGVLGLALAFTAASRGASVRVIEPRTIGAGASGGVVGALSPHAPDGWNAKKAFQLQSLIMAPEFWAKVAAAGGQDPGFARTGRLQSILDERSLAMARLREESSAELWRGLAEWRVIQAQDTAWQPPAPLGFVIKDTLSARIAPRAACRALAAAVLALGGEVIERATVSPDGPAGPIVWASGWQGLLDLGHQQGRSFGDGVKGQAVLLAHEARQMPQIYHDALHIVPHGDGTTAIGSTSETSWQDPEATDDQAMALLARARAALPSLAGAQVVETWAGIRPRAKSRAPLMGPWPGRPGHFVLNGGFKIGFGMAPLMAKVMADLVLDGQDAIPASFRI